MTPQDESRQLRHRQRALSARIDRIPVDDDPPPAEFVGVVVRVPGDTWPPLAGSPYWVKQANLIGSNAIGSTLTTQPFGSPFPVRNLNGVIPPNPALVDDAHRSIVVVVSLNGRSFFTFGRGI